MSDKDPDSARKITILGCITIDEKHKKLVYGLIGGLVCALIIVAIVLPIVLTKPKGFCGSIRGSACEYQEYIDEWTSQTKYGYCREHCEQEEDEVGYCGGGKTCKCCKPCSSDMVRVGHESGPQDFKPGQLFKVFVNYDHYNWTEAQQICEEEDMTLAEPKDPPALVYYLLRRFPDHNFWLGARADEKNGSFHWSMGDNEFGENYLLSSSPYWAAGYGPGEKRCKPDGECCLRSYPDQNTPYQAWPCSLTYYGAICQCK